MEFKEEFFEYKRPLNHIVGHLIGYLSVILSIFYFEYCLYIIICTFLLGMFIKGSEHSLIYILFGVNKPKIKIQGFVAPGYEKVFAEFKNNFLQGMERGAQYVVYHKNELVVNLWGNFDLKNQPDYDQNSLQNVFSSSKVVTSVVVATLVEKGFLKYEEKVCRYWPEFAKNGKENITVEQVLRHEGGMPITKPMVQLEQLYKKNLKNNGVGKTLENMTPSWNTFTPRTYHAVSRGYILNEIVRRVDPQGRTVGEILSEEITKPLQAEFYFGVPENKEKNIKKFVSTLDSRILWVLCHGLIPFEFLGRKLMWPGFICILIKIFFKITSFGKKMIDYNTVETAKVEIPSANGNGSALGMAKIAGIMANKGTFQNKKIINEKTWDLATSDPQTKRDSGIVLMKTTFVKGGWNIYDKTSSYCTFYDDYGFMGWQGMGGSLVNWHSEENLAVAYAQNLMDGDLSNKKALKLRQITFDCHMENKKKT